MEFTFKQPVRGGYYHIVVGANDAKAALGTLKDLLPISQRRPITGPCQVVSAYEEDEHLRLSDDARTRLALTNACHRFVPVWPMVRNHVLGHKGYLPE